MEMEDDSQVNLENATQADFLKNEMNFDIDPNDPLTKAALSDTTENEWMDILGNGQLRKKTITRGKKGARPERADLCTVDIIGKLQDNNKIVENFESLTIQLGDAEIVQGLDLAIALMEEGEDAEIEVASRFAYGELGKEPDIPPGATIIYEVKLKSVQIQEEIDTLGFAQRKELGNKKRERGNWWFARDEPTIAIQCYRRALEFLLPSNEDGAKKPEEKITDAELQILLEDRSKVYNNLAAAQIKSEAYEAALESVENVLRVEPNNIKALFRKGRILHKKGNHALAVTTLQYAAKLDPDSKAIQNELTILKEKSARDSLYEKNLYRKMLGGTKQNDENNSTKNHLNSSSKLSNSKSKIAVWSLIGGTIVAVTGIIVYRLTF
ncbi:hypothetical protein PV328_006447 [Microctonus aethiopoides]|uniref:peptidylprolyl isomerase n=1 Tax=Microctonus aethiopoides TaxID=144406 RepID=A0AA39KTI3_9HYME|nr:hypothetical protein PV328_006447 [Microctonus aethiopoides]